MTDSNVGTPTVEPQPVAGVWRRTLIRAAIAPALLLAPLIATAPRADNRFYIYMFGGEYERQPWRIVSDELSAVSERLDLGNFRPLGRILERSLDLLSHYVSTSFQLPVNVAMRIVHLLSAMVLAVVITVFAEAVASREPLRSTTPSRAAPLLALSFAGLLVAAGGVSTLVIFTDLYFLSSALAIAAVLAVVRHRWLRSPDLPVATAGLAALAGAGLASFNEIAYIAPPLAAVAVLARGKLSMQLSWQELRRTAAAKVVVVGSAGFAAVFLPVRAIISARCADGGCYDGTEIALTSAIAPALTHRTLSWLPWNSWAAATENTTGRWYLTANPVTMLLIAAIVILAWHLLRSADSLRRLDPGQVSALAVLGATTLLLGAALVSLSVEVQSRATADWPLGMGWRDTQLTVAGGALLLTSGILAIERGVSWPRGRALAYNGGVLALVLLASGTVLANQTHARIDARTPESVLHNRIALEMSNAIDDRDGDRHRCELLGEFAELHPERGDWHVRLEDALDASMRARYGYEWCRAGWSP
jgi:hypothetical protein